MLSLAAMLSLAVMLPTAAAPDGVLGGDRRCGDADRITCGVRCGGGSDDHSSDIGVRGSDRGGSGNTNSNAFGGNNFSSAAGLIMLVMMFVTIIL